VRRLANARFAFIEALVTRRRPWFLLLRRGLVILPGSLLSFVSYLSAGVGSYRAVGVLLPWSFSIWSFGGIWSFWHLIFWGHLVLCQLYLDIVSRGMPGAEPLGTPASGSLLGAPARRALVCGAL
jgi:hypothetical protein